MSRDINPFGLRMPEGLREKLEAAAKKSARSLNSEIVLRLEESLQFDEGTFTDRLNTLQASYDKLAADLRKIRK